MLQMTTTTTTMKTVTRILHRLIQLAVQRSPKSKAPIEPPRLFQLSCPISQPHRSVTVKP